MPLSIQFILYFLCYLIKLSLELVLELEAKMLRCISCISKINFLMGFHSPIFIIFICDLQMVQLLPIKLTKGTMKFYF